MVIKHPHHEHLPEDGRMNFSEGLESQAQLKGSWSYKIYRVQQSKAANCTHHLVFRQPIVKGLAKIFTLYRCRVAQSLFFENVQGRECSPHGEAVLAES